MTVAELFVRCLEAEGVRYVFGVPGEENEDLLFALEASSIQFIPTRHEQGAAFMADVWGRLTGKAGVCLSTLGPGATNLMTGVADAYLDKSPLVAITGQAGLDRTQRESHQYLDILSMFKSITKWNGAVTDPTVVAEVVRKAFKYAEQEKPGATHIELSEDMAKLPTTEEPLAVARVRRPDADRTAIAHAAEALHQARRPMIIAGNGAVRTIASQELRTLVEYYQMPVAHTFMGQGAISDASPQSLHTIGLRFRDVVMEAVERADLILTVGYDIAEYAPEAWNPRKDKPIVHIDFTPAEVYTHYVPCVEVVADISAALRQLRDQLQTRHCTFDTTWYAPIQQRIRDDIASYTLPEDAPLTVPGALNVVRAVLQDEDLLISDVGAHKMWIARNFPVCCPNGCLISNGLASMGIALPGGVAASLHDPARRIVAAMGDGGFLMNAQELETAKRLGLAFTVLVFNDNDYGLISWKQRAHRQRSTGTRLTNPNLVAFAESFGIRGYCAHTPAELRQQLQQTLAQHELAVIEIPIDQADNARLNDELTRKAER